MDSDDLVIIDDEFTPHNPSDTFAPAKLDLAKRGIDSDEESDSNSHPIIHTNTFMRNGRYRYHNYLRDTNDNCTFCHDFLLQAYRERHFGACPPPPALMAPVGRCEILNGDPLSDHTASPAAPTASATDAPEFLREFCICIL
jgi:hypothetical protein